MAEALVAHIETPRHPLNNRKSAVALTMAEVPVSDEKGAASLRKIEVVRRSLPRTSGVAADLFPMMRTFCGELRGEQELPATRPRALTRHDTFWKKIFGHTSRPICGSDNAVRGIRQIQGVIVVAMAALQLYPRSQEQGYAEKMRYFSGF